ncbi:alpha/beta hydrolase [Streptomyces sp. NBC_01304]|uniref:alpha/beta hydrolase n=1 Tax=Streptomyces sp. NBC_01304 TaxID=2903818 RepID=UPI002E1669FC|nr:alpha/beta hydrolase [Streptomyces sp. NBC_01304]
MKKIKRRAALVAASAAVFSLTVPLAASAAPEGRAPDGPAWERCEGGGADPRQECATVQVPLDYADPDGRQISLAISRIRSEKPQSRRGALLLIPGGPGNTGLNGPTDRAKQLPASVRDAYDLIGFDPRGLGRSTPVSCGFARGDLSPMKLRPWPGPDGSLDESVATGRRMARACERSGEADGGALLRSLTTANEARDLDRIRAALGERKISAWSVSYGTYPGAVYNQLFPHRVDRLVLDSNDNPDPTKVGRGWIAAHEAGVEDSFPAFAKWASDPGNPLRLAQREDEVRPLFLHLAQELDRKPIPWPGANPAELNGNVLRHELLSALYAPRESFDGLAELILAARAGKVPPAPPAPPEDFMQNAATVGTAVVCNDVKWPTDAATYQRGVDESRARFPLTAGMPRGVTPCAFWPYAPKEPPVRITDRGPSNVLLVQNARDVATPLAGALELRKALGGRARMVTVDSTGHDAYLDNGNECGDRTVTRYLVTGKRPGRDVYCATAG